MAFNDIELRRIEQVVGGFCRDRIPDHLRSQIKVFYEVRGYEVKILESRPSFVKSHEWTETQVARLKYDPKTMGWHLYWMRASGKWQEYPEIKAATDLKFMINEIQEDPHRVFWGWSSKSSLHHSSLGTYPASVGAETGLKIY
jgi:hypothetical protein